MSQPIDLNNISQNDLFSMRHTHGPSSSSTTNSPKINHAHGHPSSSTTPSHITPQRGTPLALANYLTHVSLHQTYRQLLPHPDTLVFLRSPYFSNTMKEMAVPVAEKYGHGVEECVGEFRRFVALKAWVEDWRGDRVGATALMDELWLLALSNTKLYEMLQQKLGMPLRRAVGSVSPQEKQLKVDAMKVIYRKFFTRDALSLRQPGSKDKNEKEVEVESSKPSNGSNEHDVDVRENDEEDDMITLDVMPDSKQPIAITIRVNKHLGPEAIMREIEKASGWRYMEGKEVLVFGGEVMDLESSLDVLGVSDGGTVYLAEEFGDNWGAWGVMGAGPAGDELEVID